MLQEGSGIRCGRGIVVLMSAVLLVLAAAGLASAQDGGNDTAHVLFFHSTTCPHCIAEKAFLEKLEDKYPRLRIDYIIAEDNWELYEETCRRYNSTPSGVPRTFIGDMVFVGFVESECKLKWYQANGGYIGCSNQIEDAVRSVLNLSVVITDAEAMTIARKSGLVSNLTSAGNDAVANAFLIGEVYNVAWWTPERINSNLDYPNVLVVVDAKTGEVLSSETPDKMVPGVYKPQPQPPGFDYSVLALVILIFILAIAFMLFGTKMDVRYWASAFMFAFIALMFVYSKSLPSMDVVDYATHQSFPVFTFIIAIVDGFNPCAFAVLAFLLSILTHTKSRKKMLTIGTVFILTSGFVYFLFIIAVLMAQETFFSEYQDIIRLIVAAIALAAGAINLKDFFFFKQGISLTLSTDEQNTIFKRAGKLVKSLEVAEKKREMLLVVLGTMALAAMVNLVELGCTFILPMVYLQSLTDSFPNDLLMYLLYTAFYAAVYIIPLFAILGSFIYTFKSERVSETQAKVLKLVGGFLMVALGLMLLFKPELLVFG